MRKIFAAVFTVSLFACNDSGTKTASATTENTEIKANVPTNTYGFTPTYSASFVMDSAKNTETVLALWKEWKDGDLSHSRSHFADTVAFFMADGTSMSGATDSLIKNMQGYRSSFKSMETSVEAIFATKSTDKDENDFHRIRDMYLFLDAANKMQIIETCQERLVAYIYLQHCQM